MIVATVCVLCAVALAGWIGMWYAYHDGIRIGYVRATLDIFEDLHDLDPEALRDLLDWYITRRRNRIRRILDQINSVGEDDQ
jgi:hypothetical protein